MLRSWPLLAQLWQESLPAAERYAGTYPETDPLTRADRKFDYLKPAGEPKVGTLVGTNYPSKRFALVSYLLPSLILE